ncbi:hypothetical protein AVEN_222958-1 [Araneus ventricosus]|uniref:Uncharacterized protein n=1 Tax=Araneus ventricosus TaxID=182803 RepID=A0A4Y2W027_ARAVE|nr:hypothetical protein AVEN_222958-1 [Araneus ventricosus]
MPNTKNKTTAGKLENWLQEDCWSVGDLNPQVARMDSDMTSNVIVYLFSLNIKVTHSHNININYRKWLEVRFLYQYMTLSATGGQNSRPLISHDSHNSQGKGKGQSIGKDASLPINYLLNFGGVDRESI